MVVANLNGHGNYEEEDVFLLAAQFHSTLLYPHPSFPVVKFHISSMRSQNQDLIKWRSLRVGCPCFAKYAQASNCRRQMKNSYIPAFVQTGIKIVRIKISLYV